MTLTDFIKIIISNIILVITIPTLVIVLVLVGTINTPKEYTSRTTVYTGIVSGNNMGNNLGVGGKYVVPSIFDNLKTIKESGKVLQKVSFKLLTQHILLDSSDKEILSQASLDHLYNLIPEDIISSLKVPGDFNATYKRIEAFTNKNRINPIYKLQASKEYHYSIYALSRIQFYRLKQSDIIALEYKSDDPALCVHTLNFFLDEFIQNYKSIKLSETSNIIEYFISQINDAEEKLKVKEANLQKFREDNNILDYIEQVRAIALKKEDMEGEFYDEKMRYASAKSSVEFIEKELKIYENLMTKNQQLVITKEQLEKVSAELATAKLLGGISDQQIEALRTKASKLKVDIELVIYEIAKMEYTKTGKNTKALLLQWLENVIAESKSKAKLEIFEERKASYKKTYQDFSPLGSEITRLEREVGVSEQEYLRMVESLNLAQLRKQNADLTTNLSVVDAPFFPMYPNPSKRITILIIAGILGLLFIIGILILLELTDSTLKNIDIFKEKTNLNFAGAIPRIEKNKKVNYDNLLERSIKLTIDNIQNKIKDGNIIAISSTQKQDGKSFIGELLKKQLIIKGYEIKLLKINENKEIENLIYSKNGSSNRLELAEKTTISSTGILILELPDLMDNPLPDSSIKIFDLILNVTRANRKWKKSESAFLENLKLKTKNIYGIVNGLKLQYLEAFTGEIPKSRNKIRILLKRLSEFEFKGSSYI